MAQVGRRNRRLLHAPADNGHTPSRDYATNLEEAAGDPPGRTAQDADRDHAGHAHHQVSGHTTPLCPAPCTRHSLQYTTRPVRRNFRMEKKRKNCILPYVIGYF